MSPVLLSKSKKAKPSELKMFEECILPFMELNRYYTSKMLEHDIPLRHRKSLYYPISRVLSTAFRSGKYPIEREDTRNVHFYRKYHKIGKFAYRIIQKTSEIQTPATLNQLELPLHVNTVHDIH